MSRTYLQRLSVLAITAMAGSAFAAPAEFNAVDVISPVFNGGVANTAPDTEFIGPRTSVQVNYAGSAVLAAGTANITEIRFVGLNAAGAETAAVITLNTTNGTVAAVGGAFPTVAAGTVTVNLGDASLAAQVGTFFLTNPPFVEVTLSSAAAGTQADANRTASNFNITGATPEVGVLGTGAAGRDECLSVDQTQPTVTGAFINGGNLFVQYSKQLTLTGGAPVLGTNVAANENAAGVTVNDFQVIAAPGPFTFADGTGVATATFGAATIVGAGHNILSIPLTVPGNIVLGNQIRPASTGTPANAAAAGATVTDYLKTKPFQTSGVTLTAPPALAVTSAKWTSTVPNNGVGTNALRVTFSNPIATAGSTNFYKVILGGAVSAVTTVTGAALDPTDTSGQSVILQITVANGDATEGGVAADGTSVASGGASSGFYSVQTQGDNTGVVITEPTDIYGGTITSTAATTTAAADGIAPSLTGGAPTFLDTNGDGALDAIALVFNEPIAPVTSSTGFELTVNGGVNVTPFFLIDPVTGAFTTTPQPATVASATAANRVIPISGVTTGSVRLGNPTVTTRNTNNAVIVAFNPNTFDWNNNGTTRGSATPDATEAVPGTADGAAIQVIFNSTTASITSTPSGATVAPATITDVATNKFVGGAPLASATGQAAATDGAAPVLVGATFFTGDNQNGGSNAQLVSEQDGVPGDGALNNRVALIFGENLGGAATNNTLLQFGAGGNTFNPGDNLFTGGPAAGGANNGLTNSIITFGTNNALTQVNAKQIQPGVALTLVKPGTGNGGFSDGSGNNATFTGKTAAGSVAPYIALTTDVNQVTENGAYLIDSNGDGFVDSIRAKFTQLIDGTSLQASDWTLSGGGTISAVALGSTLTPAGIADDSTVVFTVTDGVVPVNSTGVTLTYNGGTAGAKLVKAQAAPKGNGVAVNAVTVAITPVKTLQSPVADDREIAQQAFTGVIRLDATNLAPAGTKIFAMIAVPAACAVTATHNNVEFVASRTFEHSGTGSFNSDNASLNAWTNLILGIKRNVYLAQDATNHQFYQNEKFISTSGNQQADVSLASKVINCVANVSNLSNITFTGTGQTSTDKITGGKVQIFWDVLRSNDGTLAGGSGLYTAGYNIFGAPILSRGVVTDNTGSYAMHVSAPSSAFNGISRLDCTGRPIIFVVELPDGRRFAVSSLLTSAADGGKPILFKTQIGQSDKGDAVGATVFNVNLANVAGGNPQDSTNQVIQAEWNTISYARDGGWSTSSSTQALLPNGVTPSSTTSSTRLVTGTTLTGVNALDQFVYWYDNDGTGPGGTGDGMWTAADDFNAARPFDGIAVDTGGFASFSFTMTNKGVLLGSGINSLVGGYAFGFFNATGSNLGLFQFGPRFAASVTSIFPKTGSGIFPTNGATKGWALAASATQLGASGTISAGTAFLTANDPADYLIIFKNSGPNPAGGGLRIDVQSHGAAAGQINNVTGIADEQAVFVHYAP